MLPRIRGFRGHTLITSRIRPSPFVIDCGAHKGQFSREMIDNFGAKGHSIEASPSLFNELDLAPDFECHNFAVGSCDGEVAFTLSSNPESSRTGTVLNDEDMLTIMVKSRSFSEFFAEIAVDRIDVLKLDIEGSEISAIESLSDFQICSIEQITVEFHDFCGLVSPAEVSDAITRIRNLGFKVFCFSFSTRGDVLFVNTRWRPVGRVEAGLIGLGKVFRGLVRRVTNITQAVPLAVTF